MRVTLSLIVLLTLATVATGQENWTRFRGPNGTGIADAIDFPSEFTESDYCWIVDLPGKGVSSPVVCDKQVVVTHAGGDVLNVSAFDLDSGTPLWSTPIKCVKQKMHAANSTASATPAADSSHYYVAYGDQSAVYLAALDRGGKVQWEAKLPRFDGPHGFGSSPVVVGDVVCLNIDTGAGCYLVAFDTTSGAERWRAERSQNEKETYSTPCTIEVAGRTLIVAESTGGGLQAVEPQYGTVAWSLSDVLPARTVSSPCVAGDMLIATCGSGGSGHVMVAAKYDAADASVAYTLDKNVPYVPTILAKDGLLFLWHDQGIVTCVDSETRDVVWRKRIGGGYYGSPVCVGNRLVALSREGKAVVLAASRNYELLGETDLGEASEATPAVAGGRLLLRTDSKLVCLGGRKVRSE